MASFAAFLSFAFVMAFTPGPNNIMALSNAGAHGFRKGFRFCFGVLLGFLGVMASCALFDAALFHLLPAFEPFMKAVGALYILWLAWGVLRSGNHDEGGLRASNSVMAGMALQFVNPKVILCGITAFSSFVLPWTDSPLVLSLFVVLLSFIGFAGTCCWALCGSLLRQVFRRHRAGANALLSLLLVGCAVSLYL